MNSQSTTDTYSCPHCAENILKAAVTCRFCKKDVHLDVILASLPKKEQIVEAAKSIYARIGSSRFESYGEFRKRLNTPGEMIVSGLSKAEAEEILLALELAGGSGTTPLTSFRPAGREAQISTNPHLFPMIYPFIALLSLGFALFAWYWTRRIPAPVAPTILESAHPQNEGTGPTPLPSQETFSQTQMNPPPNEPPREKSEGTNLNPMIAATATLSGGGMTGSAFFVDPSGYLITNVHVVKGMSSIRVQTSDGKSRFGTLIRRDDDHDLALVKVDGGPYPTLHLGDATTLQTGEPVWTIGAPHGLSFTVTRGIVSYVGRRIRNRAFIQADVAINPGNSGGPMINARGEVVGINNFIISNAVGLNFAVPVNYIYMGSDPIMRSILPTREDNPLMAQWRGWERMGGDAGDDSSPQASAEDPTAQEGKIFLANAKSLDDEYARRRDVAQEEVRRLQGELQALQAKESAGRLTISAEQENSTKMSTIRKEIIRREISFIDETISYTNRVEGLFDRAKGMVLGNEAKQKAIDTQIAEIRKLRDEMKKTRAGKERQLSIEEQSGG